MNLGLCFTVSYSYRQSVGLLWRGISHPQGLYLHRTQTWSKYRRTLMPRVEFEPTTPVIGRAKTVHALDRAATVISDGNLTG
jgi:hypothetical protein